MTCKTKAVYTTADLFNFRHSRLQVNQINIHRIVQVLGCSIICIVYCCILYCFCCTVGRVKRDWLTLQWQTFLFRVFYYIILKFILFVYKKQRGPKSLAKITITQLDLSLILYHRSLFRITLHNYHQTYLSLTQELVTLKTMQIRF